MDVVNTLFTAVINTAAENAREILRTTDNQRKGKKYPDPRASDRFSGADLSRCQLPKVCVRISKPWSA